MESFYRDNHITNYNKDCRDMSELPAESVQCVVTSPPYWGLRKYSGEQELIWGDNHCGHQWGDIIPNPLNTKNPNRGPNSIVGRPTRLANQTIRTDKPGGNNCSLCGAWKGAFGLEPTPEMYVQHTIEILREIRRVLRKDGVVFWNIGDSYGSGKGTCFNPGGGKGSFSGHGDRKDVGAYPLDRGNVSMLKASGLKPKDLCLIPFRIAIAAQEDGWWVRSVIIWSKPNPMPESVTDRPTESHEYILMLTKSAKYYWDADAVRLPIAESTIGRGPVDFGGAKGRDYQPTADDPQYRGGNEQWGRTYHYNGGGRNIRSVWEFPTQPYPEAHFAVFPEKLPEICIKAATPEVGCCSKCGKPWVRVIQTEYTKGTPNISGQQLKAVAKRAGGESDDETMGYKERKLALRKTLNWQPTCKCDADKIPSLVLDPFAGAGTTLWVAKKLNRRAVGYEISEKYCDLIVKRNRQLALEFT